MAQRDLDFVIKFKAEAEQALVAAGVVDKLGKSTNAFNAAGKVTKGILNDLGFSMRRLAIIAGTLGATLLTAGKGLSEFAKFEQGLKFTQTLIPGATENMGELREAVERLGVDSGQSFEALNRGLFETISAFGLSEDTVSQFEVANRAAVAGLTDTTSAVQLLSAVSKGYNDTSAEMVQKISDLAFTTVRLGQTTFPELASSVTRVTASAKELGVEIESVFGVFATLTGVTGETAEVSTQLAGIFAALQRESKELKDVFKVLGVDGAKQLIAENGLRGALLKIKSAADQLGLSMIQVFGRVESSNAVLALTGSQSENLRKKLLELKDAAGATELAYKEMTDTLQNAFDRIKNVFNLFVIALGEGYAPVVHAVAAAVEVLARAFLVLHPAVRATLAVMVSIVPLMLTMATPVLILVKAWRLLGPVIAKSTGFLGIFVRAATAGMALVLKPVLLVVAAVTAISAAWDALKGVTITVGGEQVTLANLLAAAWTEMGVLWKDLAEGFDLFMARMKASLSLILPDFDNLWKSIKTGAAQAVGQFVQDIALGIDTSIAQVQTLGQAFSIVWNEITVGAKALFGDLKLVFSAFGAALRGDFEQAGELLSTAFSNRFDGKGTGTRIAEELDKAFSENMANSTRARDALVRIAKAAASAGVKEAGAATGADALPDPGGSLSDDQQKFIDSLTASVEKLQFQLSLVGKTKEEIKLATLEYDLLVKATEEGLKGHGATKEAIAAVVEETRKLGAAQAESKARDDIQKKISQLEFERDLIGQTTIQQEIANAVRAETIRLQDVEFEGKDKLIEAYGRQVEATAVATEAHEKQQEQIERTAELIENTLDSAIRASSDLLKGWAEDGELQWQRFAAAAVDAITEVLKELLLLKAGVEDQTLAQSLAGLISGKPAPGTEGAKDAGTVISGGAAGPAATPEVGTGLPGVGGGAAGGLGGLGGAAQTVAQQTITTVAKQDITTVAQGDFSAIANASMDLVNMAGGIEFISSAGGIEFISTAAGIEFISTAAGIEFLSTAAGIEFLSTAAGIEFLATAAGIEFIATSGIEFIAAGSADFLFVPSLDFAYIQASTVIAVSSSGGGYAEGGIIPAVPGGRSITVAEGGETEAIIPLSRADEFGFGANGNGQGVQQQNQININIINQSDGRQEVDVEANNEQSRRDADTIRALVVTVMADERRVGGSNR